MAFVAHNRESRVATCGFDGTGMQLAGANCVEFAGASAFLARLSEFSAEKGHEVPKNLADNRLRRRVSEAEAKMICPEVLSICWSVLRSFR